MWTLVKTLTTIGALLNNRTGSVPVAMSAQEIFGLGATLRDKACLYVLSLGISWMTQDALMNGWL
jgi:hypothetical protein